MKICNIVTVDFVCEKNNKRQTVETSEIKMSK